MQPRIDTDFHGPASRRVQSREPHEKDLDHEFFDKPIRLTQGKLRTRLHKLSEALSAATRVCDPFRSLCSLSLRGEDAFSMCFCCKMQRNAFYKGYLKIKRLMCLMCPVDMKKDCKIRINRGGA